MSSVTIFPESYPPGWQNVLLHHHLLQYAKVTPDACAIISPQGEWTYQQLADYAYSYAKIIHGCGLTTGDRVILELESCPQAVALIAACSILGLVFVPISPQSPRARVVQIIATTQARLHIQASSTPETSSPHPQPLQGRLMGDKLEIYGSEAQPSSPQKKVLESDLAYIIFTSGTTGEPKGIMMSHRAALAFFRGLVDACGLDSSARVGTIAPLQFDFSLLDMGLALGSGATLVQVPRNATLIPKRLVSYLDQHRVTQMNGVPSIWRVLLRHAAEEVGKLQHIKSILCGGEPFPLPDLRKLQFLLPNLRIINCFGQSESIACSFTEVPNPLSEETINLSVGFAHPGAEMLLIDEEGREITEPGKVGEIYLRGASLFSGYWRNPEATAKVLVNNPLQPLTGEKVFRTGDLAFKGDHGELYLAGRGDFQVKILGNRIEPEEVERTLLTYPGIVQAAVIAREDSLIAFVVTSESQVKPTPEELRTHCGKVLPRYMIPAQIHFFSSFPMTINGKVDRKKLLSLV